MYDGNAVGTSASLLPDFTKFLSGGCSMNWKTVLMLLLSFMLVFSVFAGCTQEEEDAVENVRKLVDALPSEELAAMEELFHYFNAQIMPLS